MMVTWQLYGTDSLKTAMGPSPALLYIHTLMKTRLVVLTSMITDVFSTGTLSRAIFFGGFLSSQFSLIPSTLCHGFSTTGSQDTRILFSVNHLTTGSEGGAFGRTAAWNRNDLHSNHYLCWLYQDRCVC